MNDFNKGIDFAFEYIENNLIGKPVSGNLQPIITKEMLDKLKKNIPKKCASCTKPCGESWCYTNK